MPALVACQLERLLSKNTLRHNVDSRSACRNHLGNHTASPTTRHTSILDLPCELILYILEDGDSTSDLSALIATAPIFRDVWKVHTATMSTKVLSREIGCWLEALELDEARRSNSPVELTAEIRRHDRMASGMCLSSYPAGSVVATSSKMWADKKYLF